MAALLQVSGLHAAYGPTRVLHGIDFALEEGSITALLGANGAGKTTTLRALCAMVQTSGEISFGGMRIERKSPRISCAWVSLMCPTAAALSSI